MAWVDPLADLRLVLNDDAHGNLVKSKTVWPRRGMNSDGRLTRFLTFEDRLLATEGPQSGSASPLRLFYDDTEVAASGVVVTDATLGEFTVMGAAPSGVQVKASYYYREWLDEELQMALRQGAQQCNTSKASDVPEGLQAACLDFAAAWAHRRAAHRWQQRKAQQFLLEEAQPNEAADQHVQFHLTTARELMEEGRTHRTDYYQSRLGMAQSPAWGLLKRQPTPWTPRR